MPRIAIFICAIEEYAIIRLISTWRNVEKEVYTIDITHNIITAEEKYLVAFGNIGKSTRKKP